MQNMADYWKSQWAQMHDATKLVFHQYPGSTKLTFDHYSLILRMQLASEQKLKKRANCGEL